MISDAWRAKRLEVIARAGGICEKCKERRGVHVHHFFYGNRQRGTEPLDWLQLVCLKCHGDYHPNHTFRTVAEQKALKARRERNRKRKGLACRHCGGTYTKAQHRAICVRFNLHLGIA